MGNEGAPCSSVSSVSSASDDASRNKIVDQPSALEQDIYHPDTSSYDSYPGLAGPFQPLDATADHCNTPGGSYTSDDDPSLLDYQAGCDHPYAAGLGLARVDGRNQTYGSETYGSDSTGTSDLSGSKMGQSGTTKSYNIAKAGANPSRPTSAFPSYSKAEQSSSSSKPFHKNLQPLEPRNKLGFRPVSKLYMNKNLGSAGIQSGAVNNRSNGRVWNNKCGEFGASTRLTRGPRLNQIKSTRKVAEVEQPGRDYTKRVNKYNLQDFPVEYEDAKFYIIKPLAEDDVHKSIKYNVWSSTSNGNMKLDAAFEEADAKTSETGKLCPVFLFFSVNGSGQFVGVAEMIGPVDFSKDMDFWQVDNWKWFFPTMWHIIKDVPNIQFRHIFLEDNESKPVTHTKDTRQVGLKHGLEMLRIFKSYEERTSILEDFNFYENREKSIRTKRRKPKGALALENC